MGLSFLLSGALRGNEVWQAPTTAFQASPFRWLNWLTESRATITTAPNMAYGLIGKYSRRITDVDLASVRFALNGGEPVDCGLTARFASELARFGFSAGALGPSYGLAECTCAVTVPEPGRGLLIDESNAVLGHAIPGMAVRIDPRDSTADHGGREVGEIAIRGSSMMSGYLGDVALAADEWFPTGDLGYFVDGGLVVAAGSRSSLPWRAERLPRRSRTGGRASARCHGEPSPPSALGNAPFVPAWSSLQNSRGPDEAATRGQLIARVASECGIVPSDVRFVRPGTLPRTSSGKLRRLEIKRGLDTPSAPCGEP